MRDHNKNMSMGFIWYLSKWPQRYLINFVGANWWQLQCGQNTISNRWKGRAIGNCFRISNKKCADLCKPWKKEFIALLKVRIKMQCCFKCRRGSWPLLIFAICLSIAAPASSYLLLIFPLQLNVLSPAKSRLHGCGISGCGGVGVSSFLPSSHLFFDEHWVGSVDFGCGNASMSTRVSHFTLFFNWATPF